MTNDADRNCELKTRGRLRSSPLLAIVMANGKKKGRVAKGIAAVASPDNAGVVQDSKLM
jgi:hypothetical protein